MEWNILKESMSCQAMPCHALTRVIRIAHRNLSSPDKGMSEHSPGQVAVKSVLYPSTQPAV